MIIALSILSIVVAVQAFWIWKLRRELGSDLGDSLDADNPELLAKTRRQLYREISRHESTGELLRETQQYLQSTINSMPSILIGINAKGEITHRNLAASTASKLSDEKAIGAHINIVYPDWPITDSLISETIKIREVYRRENIQIGRGSGALFIDLTLYPLIGDNITGAVVQVVDVSKQVRVESMLIQSDKMMSLGEMAAGLAHEINNPLASILNNAQNIERRTSADLPKNKALADAIGLNLDLMRLYLEEREVLSFVKRIRSSGEQAAQIVKNMLEFSRVNYQTHKPHDISELIDDALELTRKNLELHTSLGIEMPKMQVTLGDNLSLLPCSATEIKQVLVNLIRNAAQAFQSDEYGPPLDPSVHIDVSQVDDIMIIEIKDNGPGMVESIRRHIFEPFFTTKDVGKGTGLGLSVSYFIVTEHHHGTIEVDSKPGEGSIFTLKLPTKSQAKAPPENELTQSLMT